MAEILGAVASGISLAHLAAKIVSTGFKIAEVLKQVHGVPEEISYRLQQLEILAISLAGLETTGMLGFPAWALGSCKSQCEDCLQELRAFLEGFERRVQDAKGLKKRAVITRFLLKEDGLLRLERRLSAAMDVLSQVRQAQMSHLMWHNQERLDRILLQGRETAKFMQSMQQVAGLKSNRDMMCISRCDEASSFLEDAITFCRGGVDSHTSVKHYEMLRIGNEYLTGVLEIGATTSKTHDATRSSEGSSTSEEAQEDKARIGARLFVRVKVPQWLSTHVLEVNFNVQSSGAWKRLFSPGNSAFEDDSELFERLEYLVQRGDVLELRKSLDEKAGLRLNEYTYSNLLLFIALQDQKWSIINLLLDRGARPWYQGEQYWGDYCELHAVDIDEHDIDSRTGWWRHEQGGDNIMQLQRLIQREHQNDLLCAVLLRHYEGSGESFNRFRRSVWPDQEYYHSEFHVQRMRVAISLGTGAPITPTQTYRMIQYALSHPEYSMPKLDLSISDNFGTTLLHCLAEAIGCFQGTVQAVEWHELVRHVLRKASSHETELHLPCRSQGPDYETPFIRLLQGALGCKLFQPIDRRSSTQRCLRNCQAALVLWLSDLQSCGVDLMSYGREEQLFLHQSNSKRDIRTKLHSCWYGAPLRLIDFDFGATPHEWRLYWSESTDVFAGEFWSLVEPHDNTFGAKSLSTMPGSWPSEICDGGHI